MLDYQKSYDLSRHRIHYTALLKKHYTAVTGCSYLIQAQYTGIGISKIVMWMELTSKKNNGWENYFKYYRGTSTILVIFCFRVWYWILLTMDNFLRSNFAFDRH